MLSSSAPKSRRDPDLTDRPRLVRPQNLHPDGGFAQLYVQYLCNSRLVGSTLQRLARPFSMHALPKDVGSGRVAEREPEYVARVGAAVRLPEAPAIAREAPAVHAWRGR